MLINSVLLSLNQLLPLAILYVMLYLISDNKFTVSNRLSVVSACLLVALFYVSQAAVISEWFDFNGLEISQICFAVMVYVCALYGARYGFTALQIGATLLFATLLYLSHYITFLAGFWSSTEFQSPLMIGTLLGLGICLSFSILLYFILAWLVSSFGVRPLLVLFALNVSAKLVMALDRAGGIDLIAAQPALFDLRPWLAENSELGRILTAFIGFEATPSALGLGIYFSGIVLLLVLSRENPGFQRKRLT